MWKLVPVAQPGLGQPHCLLVGVDYVVGRKNCAIIIKDDNSISRSHAALSVSHPPVNLSQIPALPVLTLKDTSKYGTFVNGEKLSNDNIRTLKSGDRVTFGVFESKYRVEYEPLVVCSSCLDVSRKSVLNQSIQLLGGHVVSEWKEECTHLVMLTVKVTVKTICALICGRPIIKPEYFAELIEAIQSKQQLPKPESFCPPVDEPSIRNEKIDLAVCPERKEIFRGKTFVFLTAKQHAKLSPAVTLGGGEAKLMTDRPEDTARLTAPDVCVIDVGFTNSQASISDSERVWIDTTIADLQRKKYRTISEAEIGLAVLFASTERCCNPRTPLDAGITPATSESVVPGSSLSQRAVVDETLMPPVPGDITAYVADTEMEQLVETCMELIGENKITDTPLRRQKGKSHPLDGIIVKETPARTSLANMEEASSRLNKRPETDQNSLSVSPSKRPGFDRSRGRSSQQQSNSIKNYFQAATKKRDRSDEGETSVSKHAKLDEELFQASSGTQPVPSLLWETKAESSQKRQCTLNQKTSQSYINTNSAFVTEHGKLEKTAAENMSAEKLASRKRKQSDDFLEDAASLEHVFESKDIDWEEDAGGRGEGSSQCIKKLKKLETEGGGLKESNLKDTKARRLLQENKQSFPALNQKEETKDKSSESSINDPHHPDKFASDSSDTPSRLLLSEFRSLVVSQPRTDRGCTAKTDSGHLSNFKKFKKVAFPGAGQIPHIIGGSDLVAHHAKKNSEMEEWLRQEMEEQNLHSREESLADDLFRYDPHIKRR